MDIPESPFESTNDEELVPTVDGEDIKAIWQLYGEVHRARAADAEGLGAIAMGAAVMEDVCSPGANVRNVWYRMAMLQLLLHSVERNPEEPAAQTVAKLRHGNNVNDRLFRVIARIPVKWLPKEGMQGYPFDVDEFVKQVEREAA